MPQIQKRKCSVSFGELISFLSIVLSILSYRNEEYSLAFANKIGTMEETIQKKIRRMLQKKRVTPSSRTTTLSFTPAASAARSNNWSGSSMGSCERRKVP